MIGHNSADGSFAGVQDWFPSDDRVVATVMTRPSHHSIVTVSTVDGQVRQVRSIDWGAEPEVRVSPDSRSLAYSRSASREAPERHIFLVAVDGSSETVLVEHDANDELVAWSQDGTHLLFNSDRSGQPGLWAQRVQNAEPAGEPTLLIANLDVGRGMGVTRDGSLHYPVRVTRRRLKIAELDITTGRLLAQPVNVTDRFVGSNNRGVFSPDGETLAYTSARQGWMQTAIVMRTVRTGEEWDVPHELHRVGTLFWQLDGDSVVVTGEDDRGRRGYFEVNVETGQAQPLTSLTGMWGPTFTTDGAQVLHRSLSSEGRGDSRKLYSCSVADGSVHALPDIRGGSIRFSLSPDGQRIATTGGPKDPSGNQRTEIRLHPALGGDAEVLLTTDESERFGRWITWTPDGTALLVLKQDAQAGEYLWRLWVVSIDGAEPVATELVYEPANAGATRLDIHPDGKRIVYSEGGYFNQIWAVHNLGLD